MQQYFTWQIYFLLFVSLYLGTCQETQPKKENPVQLAKQGPNANTTDWNKIVTYEIFVQSFFDSNQDGIGDIPGLISKLDYLEDLGIGAIWLMPISPSPSYHKYDVTDYFEIHPDYGTLEDFKTLVTEAHRRNIKVLIDLVINHCSRAHPWFIEAQKGGDNPYRNYFIWANDPKIAQVNAQVRVEDDHYHEHQWRKAPNNEEKYYGFFSDHMPDFNYDYPPLRQEMKAMAKYWLSELKVDGFRLDAARYIYLDNRAEDNHLWWQEFRAELETIKPDVYLVGEVWGSAPLIAPFLKGLHTAFNFDLGNMIVEAVIKEKGDSLVPQLKKIHALYQAVNKDFTDAIFIRNHDQNRLMSELGGDMNKAKMAAALLLTLPGNPFIYYGEELGMQGEKPDEFIREPFPWDFEENSQSTWLEPKYSTAEQIAALTEQEKDKNSLYHHYKELINVRNQQEILAIGELKIIAKLPSGLCSFLRQMGKEQIWVIHNLTNQAIEFEIPAQCTSFTKIIFQNRPDFVLNKNTLRVPAYSTNLLKS